MLFSYNVIVKQFFNTIFFDSKKQLYMTASKAFCMGQRRYVVNPGSYEEAQLIERNRLAFARERQRQNLGVSVNNFRAIQENSRQALYQSRENQKRALLIERNQARAQELISSIKKLSRGFK